MKRFTMLLLCAVLFMCKTALADAMNTTEEDWDKWGAGEMYSPGEPWQDGCVDIKKERCWSIAEGLLKGQEWCLTGCGYYHRKHSYRIYIKYKPWFDLFSGGTHGIMVAQTCRTESEGDTGNVTNSLHKETGLCSVNKHWAEKLNVNACDPKSNIWAVGQMRNLRLIDMRTKYSTLGDAEIDQQWKFAGAAGGAGSGKINAMWEKCGGTMKSKKPYDGIKNCLSSIHTKWMKASEAAFFISKLGLDPGLDELGIAHAKWKNLEKFQYAYSDASKSGLRKMFQTTLGYKPGLVSFRCRRGEGAEAVIAPLFASGEVPYSDPFLMIRPYDIEPYPGDDKHAKCWLFPEFKNRVPTQEEWDANVSPFEDVRDPATLKIVAGYKGKLIGKVKEVEDVPLS